MNRIHAVDRARKIWLNAWSPRIPRDRGLHTIRNMPWQANRIGLIEEAPMPDALDSVKALAAEYRRSSQALEIDDPKRARSQSDRADQLEAVAHELEEARKRLRPVSGDYGDLSDLPQSVIDQLNLSKVDELEQQMRDIVASADGAEIGIDPIIIELYRRHKVVQERRFIMNKLYRMGQKGLIQGVDGKKGVYFLPKKGEWRSQASPYDELDDDIPF